MGVQKAVIAEATSDFLLASALPSLMGIWHGASEIATMLPLGCCNSHDFVNKSGLNIMEISISQE